jgi:protein TonB
MTSSPASTRFSDIPALSAHTRTMLLLAVVALHVGLGIAIGIGLAGGAMALIDSSPSPEAYSVLLDPPPPPPSSRPAGAESASAMRAKPKAIVAAPARIPNRATTAAPAASTGDAPRSGADSAGPGTGGGTAGPGTGSGGSGDGSGTGARRTVKLAGDITATRDYPARTRTQRIGTSVIVVLTVGTDGRVHACRVHKPSPDTEADAITCRLATDRFRFRPATDRNGNPIESEFGWQQRWFAP